MAECELCGKRDRKPRNFLTLKVCRRCHGTLGLQELDGKLPPSDEFLRGLTAPEVWPRIDALNVLMSRYPRSLTVDLIATILVELEEDIENLALYSGVIAARSAFLFGEGSHSPAGDGGECGLDALLSLGGAIAAGMAAKLAPKIPAGAPTAPDEDPDEALLDGMDSIILCMLEDIKSRDVGTIAAELDELCEIISGQGTSSEEE